MDYEARMRLITGMVNTFLGRRYQTPSHLDAEGKLATIRDMAEEINAHISASSNQSALVERVEACFKALRKSYTQRAWPTPAHFSQAISEANKVVRQLTGETPSGDARSPDEISAERIKAGELVGDEWVYGRNCVKLLREGLVTQAELRRYRTALYFSAKQIGGKEYADAMEAGWIERHEAAEAMPA